METYVEPTVQNHPKDTSTGTVKISLSALQESGLTVVIAGKQTVPLYDDAFLILGPNGEKPEWTGVRGSLVDMKDPENPQQKTENTLMTLPKEALKKYVGKEVQLRYQTYGESEEYRYSKPLTLKIQP
ncbi:hypothetical protein J3P95_04675 [Pseudomonas sp. Z5-35]|uniref:hypothetical protein n=1 Tax=unclassified Pseudomonas TaxID=196821 RepID=UPI001648DD98|nr:hypothetical protein [Pseudomonas sp. SWRI154]MBC3365239.1 hypothetical protein [Pseudomonas sp. SWRI154]